jgi:hypothetical protein
VDVRVVELEPFALNEKHAATFSGECYTTFRNRRLASRALVEAGLPPLGPRWLVFNGTTIKYEVAELKRWLRERSVECGRTRFRGDTSGRTGDEGAER